MDDEQRRDEVEEREDDLELQDEAADAIRGGVNVSGDLTLKTGPGQAVKQP